MTESTDTPHPARRGLPPGERVMRLAAEPRRSIVLAASGSLEHLECVLRALAPECVARNVELVVARACSPEEYRRLAEAHESVLFMPAPDGCTRRELRALGLTAADGDVVRILDDEAQGNSSALLARTRSWLDAWAVPAREGG